MRAHRRPSSAGSPAGWGEQTTDLANSDRITWHLSLFGGAAGVAPRAVGRRSVVVVAFGRVDLDLPPPEQLGVDRSLTVISILGGADIRVPVNTSVETGGLNILGTQVVDVPGSDADAPTLRLTIFGVMSNVRVWITGVGVSAQVLGGCRVRR